MQNSFEERYRTGDTPWDHDMPDTNLVDMVLHRPVSKCKVLDIGCGTGENAIWLAQRHFEVTGCDISQTAIGKAEEKASGFDLNCAFVVANFLNDKIPGSPFGFVFDRGCLHSLDNGKDRKCFAENVSSHLEAGGLWLTLAGNTDEPPREVGPPQLTATELITTVEPYFEIVSLVASHFGSNQSDPPKAWVCLMRKRGRIQE